MDKSCCVNPMGVKTPFSRAIKTGNVEAAIMLFEHGAIVDADGMVISLMCNTDADWTNLLQRFRIT